jgi:hypothetical protein
VARTPDALLITPNGDVVEIDLPADTRSRLTVMYSILRCSAVDCVRPTSAIDMWIDDEGLYNHEDEPNIYATAFLAQFGQVAQMIMGPVLLTGGADEEGDTLPLTRDQLLAVFTKLADDRERLKEVFRHQD